MLRDERSHAFAHPLTVGEYDPHTAAIRVSDGGGMLPVMCVHIRFDPMRNANLSLGSRPGVQEKPLTAWGYQVHSITLDNYDEIANDLQEALNKQANNSFHASPVQNTSAANPTKCHPLEPKTQAPTATSSMNPPDQPSSPYTNKQTKTDTDPYDPPRR